MRIAVVGSGNIGASVGTRLARAGHEVVFTYARTPGKLERLAAGAGARGRAGEVEEASTCEVVVLSTRWGDVDEVLTRMGALPGVVLVDTINPYAPDFSMALPESTTVAEQLWPRLRPARPVKAFNTLFAPSLDPQVLHRPPLVIFLSGDDQTAKEVVARLIEDAGFEPFDLGGSDRVWLQEWHGPLYTKQYSRAEAEAAVTALDGARQLR